MFRAQETLFYRYKGMLKECFMTIVQTETILYKICSSNVCQKNVSSNIQDGG